MEHQLIEQIENEFATLASHQERFAENMRKIKQSVENNDTTFFDERPFVVPFIRTAIHTSELVINECVLSQRFIREHVSTACIQHEWTHDDIDIDPDKSVHIVYCKTCLATKK